MERRERARPAPAVRVTGTTRPVVVPVVREELEVVPEVVESETVRVSKTVDTEVVRVDAPFSHEDVEIERVPMDLRIDTVPPVRTEGATTIIPVVEEIAVVEKRLLLREEIRITKTRSEGTRPVDVRLRRERADVERLGADEPRTTESAAPGSSAGPNVGDDERSRGT